MRAASGSLTVDADENSEGSTLLAFPPGGDDSGVETTFVFDVNETLLDTSVLNEHFESAFGAARVRGEWFAEVVQRALICNAVEEYRPFPELAEAALDALAERYGNLEFRERDAILRTFLRLPVHADVPAALAHLKAHGMQVIALTNSPRDQAEHALTSAGVRDLFTMVLSAETVRRFKPDRSVYEMAARAAHDEPSRMWLISAHWWDCLGAARLGWKTLFLRREGSHNDTRMVIPRMEAADLQTAVHQLTGVTVSPAL